MRIREVKPGQRVRYKRDGKEYIVEKFAYPYNSFIARRMVALIGMTGLCKPNDLELLEEPENEDDDAE